MKLISIFAPSIGRRRVLRRAQATALQFGRGLTLALALAPAATWAVFPDKPIKVLLPFPAGGTVDVVTRLIAEEMSKKLGQPLVMDYKAGAGGTLATDLAAKAPPDGYTVMVTTPSHTINPALRSNLPFHTERDLVPVSLMAAVPELLIAHPSAPFNTLAELIAYAKANPDKVNYSSAGTGTLPHITMELLMRQAGVRATHIPYRGAAPALNDLLAGNVMLKYDTWVTSAQHMQTGKLKVLATAGLGRLPQIPTVPTVAESGFSGYQGYLWIGMIAPKGTPNEAIQALSNAIAEAVKSPRVQERLRTDGIEMAPGGPEHFGRIISSEIPQWTRIVREANISASD
jgi:tripartite-type tricarboxylate transporter receptor subunit TctC